MMLWMRIAATLFIAMPTPSLGAAILSESQQRALASWYDALATTPPNETFGELLVRAAAVQLGKPYALAPEPRPPDARDALFVRFAAFECVSLVETSLAVARCVWRQQQNAACFVRALETSRYRGGIRRDYTSRLHYFADWLEDNASRARLIDLTQALGGTPRNVHFSYMSDRPARYPPLQSPPTWQAMRAIEKRLSRRPVWVLGQNALAEGIPSLRDGDIIAVATKAKPGLLVTHVGLALHHGDAVHLLHASSSASKVVVSRETLQNYVKKNAQRIGVVVARPLPPPHPYR